MRTATYTTPIRRKSTRELPANTLNFKPMTMADIPAIMPLLPLSRSRANDFTIGGLLMWNEYFDYQYCIVKDTLFVKGVSEMNPGLVAFSLPIGRLPLKESVAMIVDYCRREGIDLRFSAVPEDRVEELKSVIPGQTRQLVDWSDYIYDIQALATLSGKKLSKKRNHVNRFIADNPGYSLSPLSQQDVDPIRVAYHRWISDNELTASSAVEESIQTLSVLDNLDRYPFEGTVLRDGNGNIVAFTLGEVIGDTLYTHIEKMDHNVAGAGETINKLFAEYMSQRHLALRYVNREEDAGDEGLRQAKLSYHPAIILTKYDLTI